MWGQRGVSLMFLPNVALLPTLLLFSGMPESGALGEPNDALIVFCLAPAHRAEVAAAARALGFASPTPSVEDRLSINNQLMDLETWREKHEKDFLRTCRAVFTARSPRLSEPTGFWEKMGEVLIPTAAGALLAFFATGWRAAVDRGARDAEALRAASAEFGNALIAYASEWVNGGEPSPATVQYRRTDLLRQLGRVRSYHPSWRKPSELRDLVAGSELAEGDRSFWLQFDKSARPAEAAKLQKKLKKLDKDLEVVAEALSRPLRSRLPGYRFRRGL